MQAYAQVTHQKNLILTASNIMMRYKSQISAATVSLNVGDIHLEGESAINCNGRGPQQTSGSGDGSLTSELYGSGAGHGGYGGGADDKNFTAGRSYVSLYVGA